MDKAVGSVDYRIIYGIFDEIILVNVIDLGHRMDIYE